MSGIQESQRLESVPGVNQHTGIKRKKLTQNLLNKLFRYEDGDLIRRVSTGRRVKVGDCAGRLKSNGYLITQIDGRDYRNHRLNWLLHYGYIPEILQTTHLELKVSTGKRPQRNGTLGLR